LRLKAAVGDDPELVAIREGLAFGKALHAHLRLPLVAERGQPTRVRPRVEPPYLRGGWGVTLLPVMDADPGVRRIHMTGLAISLDSRSDS
jgi:hypothetical protein